jgi:hypothetical protein
LKNLRNYNDKVRRGELRAHGKGGYKHGLRGLLGTGKVPPKFRREVRAYLKTWIEECGGPEAITPEQARILNSVKIATTVIVMGEKDIGEGGTLKDKDGDHKNIVRVTQTYITNRDKLEQRLKATLRKGKEKESLPKTWADL